MKSKRLFDIVGAILAMIVFSPLLLICYLSGWIGDNRPIVFSMEKKLHSLEYDLYYLEHRSFRVDLKILLLTFFNIIFGKRF